MIPQPYPLWCAQASPKHGVTIGRVIGWIENPGEGEGILGELPSGSVADYLPMIAEIGSQGEVAAISEPVEYTELFLGDSPTEVTRRAQAWMRTQDGDEGDDQSAASDLDGAMHAVWLHGQWRWITQKMSTEEREAAVAAVVRYSRSIGEGKPPLEPDGLRWWAR